jgi:hypothetical protein
MPVLHMEYKACSDPVHLTNFKHLSQLFVQWLYATLLNCLLNEADIQLALLSLDAN